MLIIPFVDLLLMKNFTQHQLILVEQKMELIWSRYELKMAKILMHSVIS